MSFTPERAAIRFGCGLSPQQAAPASVEDTLALLTGPDRAAETYPVPGWDHVLQRSREVRRDTRAFRKSVGTDEEEAKRAAMKAMRRKLYEESGHALGQVLLRRAMTKDGLRERLASFWTDHFAASGKMLAWRQVQVNYTEEAIRPYVSGRFADMLKAVITHPLMLRYLDQHVSMGPNSPVALRRDGPQGLNENLARELLELHTLGVDGPYQQQDVRQMAELLTGLTFTLDDGFKLRPGFVEPGDKTVLGRTYGGKDRLEAIFAALEDLAAHPATARHLARKLAVHFVGDTPNAGLVDAMERQYTQAGGQLLPVYEVMLTHPAAWGDAPGNVKRPLDFVGSTLRALDLDDRHVPRGNLRKMRRLFYNPMDFMGQTWGRVTGPDGWPEADDQWITPQRLAARMQWAMFAPLRLRRVLPDPREFVDMALGGQATEQVRFAAKAAETRAEGIGVVLSSAAFQRM